MTALYYTLGVVIFVVAILASIALHELGHMIPAKKFGGKVTQYFVGFGNTVWSKKVGETEYGFKAIPLGGYVKIVGMLPPGKDPAVVLDAEGKPVERARNSNTGMFTQLVSDARAAEWSQIKPEDSPRLFYKMPWWKKVIVMAGGPSVNIAIAFGIFAALFATYGNIGDKTATKPIVTSVSECAIPAAEERTDCRASDPVAPAAAMGFKVGDEIVEFNGRAVTTWTALQKHIRSNDNGQAVVVVLRDGEQVTLTGNTKVVPRPTSVTDDTLVPVGFLGVTPTLGEPVTGGIGYTLGQMGTMTVQTLEALAKLPPKVWDVAQAIVGAEERDPEGPMSLVGGGRLAGETASHEEFPIKEKTVLLLMLIASFNFFIGMFNFVPLLPLDGGHIAGALYEGLRRGFARIFRLPDPGYVDVAKLLPIAYVVAAAFLVMSLVLIVGDLVVPIDIYGS